MEVEENSDDFIENDNPPENLVEQFWDQYTPSEKYREIFNAIQKDMVLGNFTKEDEEYINHCAKIISAAEAIAKEENIDMSDPIREQLKDIVIRVTQSRGRDGFTARMLRSQFVEQRQKFTQEEITRRKKEGGLGTKLRRLVPI